MQIEELIAALGKATEGSVSLDNEISRLIGREWEVIRIGNMSEALGGPKQPVREERRENFYTTSLDAALTLVPEDPANKGKLMLWSISYDEDGVAGQRGYIAGLGKGYHDPQYIYGHSTGTPALALCIAALRARQAKP